MENTVNNTVLTSWEMVTRLTGVTTSQRTQINVESPCCTPETNITWYASYTSIHTKNSKKKTSQTQNSHTLRSSRFNEGAGGLKSKLGLKTERWLIHQEQVDQALVPLGLGPGLITVLFLDVSIAWHPALGPLESQVLSSKLISEAVRHWQMTLLGHLPLHTSPQPCPRVHPTC